MKISLPPTRFQLNFSEDAGAPWTVTRVWLSEAINASYRAVLDAETDAEGAETDALLGADAVLTLRRGAVETRTVCGVVARVEYLGSVNHRQRLRFEVVPAFELARQRIDSRIFQDASVQDILGRVLDVALGDYGRSLDVGEVERGSALRDYCTQYRESDFDFCRRLFEEEGISYGFVHDTDAGVEVLALRDANAQYPELQNLDGTAEVPVIGNNPDLADVESIQAFEWARALTTTGALRRDFDWMAPRSLSTEAAAGTDERGRTRRRYAHGRRRVTRDDLAERAIDLREADVAPGKILRGRSNATTMQPGLRFVLATPERPDLEGEYLITRVDHSGAQEQTAAAAESPPQYSNDFEAIPMATVLRPAGDTPKPRVHGPQTAIVVGPEGEEIHTDEHARVQVQLHWEERPSYAANATCWMRVRQSWAGLGWGTQFIPRIGMEVVVEFLEGNPDRPMVTGCVYNGEYPPPFALPDNKTQTGWRTNSSPGGEGFNELRFEDAKGDEQIYVHGEKDWVVEIENDHRETIGHDQHFEIGNDQTGKIGNDQTVEVGHDRRESIGNDVSETVGKVRTVSSGDNMNFTSDRQTYVQAADKITLECGAASLTMERNGNIVLKGNNLTIKGSGNVVVKGQKVSSN